jgi:hypothetical protein
MICNDPLTLLTDPLKFATLMWPHVHFYDRQVEVIKSIVGDDMTVVPAGNMLGKDFIAGFIVIWFFISRNPCRIVTTSAKDDHLRVLWGEMKRFIQSAKYPLDSERGGPLVVHHREILKKMPDGTMCPLSYVKGMVASQDSIASMQGHHVANTGDGIPRTLFVSDESSSVADDYWIMARTWAKRALIIGNTWPCSNFFYKAVNGDHLTKDPGGTIFAEDGNRCYRRVIHITAEDSPNIRLALLEKSQGKEPSGRIIIEGVKDWLEYQKNLATWDQMQQCVSLRAEFYRGAEIMLFPPDWLHRAKQTPQGTDKRQKERRTMGVDTGEGGDKTAWTVCDKYGILFQEAYQTPDTAVIPGRTLALMREWQVRPGDVLFDSGGGGKEHADLLRSQGHSVRTVGFGETAFNPIIVRRLKTLNERREDIEERYVYKNRRAEMYGLLRQRLDPKNPLPFAVPAQYAELHRQLAPIPLLYDSEGRLYLPPKNKKSQDSKEVTLKELLGCSPDESDSLVLAVYGLERKAARTVAGGSTFR